MSSGVAHADMTPDNFGVFASHHHLRARIVPPAVVPAPVLQLALGLTSAANDIDLTVCRRCGGRMRILEVVSDPDDIARVLHGALLRASSSCSPADRAPRR